VRLGFPLARMTSLIAQVLLHIRLAKPDQARAVLVEATELANRFASKLVLRGCLLLEAHLAFGRRGTLASTASPRARCVGSEERSSFGRMQGVPRGGAASQDELASEPIGELCGLDKDGSGLIGLRQPNVEQDLSNQRGHSRQRETKPHPSRADTRELDAHVPSSSRQSASHPE